jgi:TetR/AcrR family transcriptional regulator, transcriptional repressor for nem operon
MFLCMEAQPMTTSDTSARTRLLEAAMHVIRAKGYAAASVDHICRAAGVTKGAFFHHFASKDALAIAAAEDFSQMAMGLYEVPSYAEKTDPLERLLAYVDLRGAILQGELPEYTCLLGTLVQETYDTHPAIREACRRGITEHAARLEVDIAAAIWKYGVTADITAESLALYTQATIQGAFILAKAKHDTAIAAECIGHLRRYIELLFRQPESARQAA